VKNHNPWTIRATAPGQLEILLYDQIGEDWFGQGTSAKSFAQDLKDAGKVNKIHLRANPPGRNCLDGIAIHSTLLTHGAKVTAQVEGVAASIAGVIPAIKVWGLWIMMMPFFATAISSAAISCSRWTRLRR